MALSHAVSYTDVVQRLHPVPNVWTRSMTPAYVSLQTQPSTSRAFGDATADVTNRNGHKQDQNAASAEERPQIGVAAAAARASGAAQSGRKRRVRGRAEVSDILDIVDTAPVGTVVRVSGCEKLQAPEEALRAHFMQFGEVRAVFPVARASLTGGPPTASGMVYVVLGEPRDAEKAMVHEDHIIPGANLKVRMYQHKAKRGGSSVTSLTISL